MLRELRERPGCPCLCRKFPQRVDRKTYPTNLYLISVQMHSIPSFQVIFLPWA